MSTPHQLLVSDLIRCRVRRADGSDQGVGHLAWMDPPSHRLLGWASRPGAFGPARTVWRLDQLVDLADDLITVRGDGAPTDQDTLDSLPTLFKAQLFGRDALPLGSVADAVVNLWDGSIQHYLVARSDPRLPGTSRWRLSPDRIVDQQPGRVVAAIAHISELPLARASVREQLLSQGLQLRDRLRQGRERLQQDLRRAGERLDQPGEGDGGTGGSGDGLDPLLDGVGERLRHFGDRVRDEGADLLDRLRDPEPHRRDRRGAEDSPANQGSTAHGQADEVWDGWDTPDPGPVPDPDQALDGPGNGPGSGHRRSAAQPGSPGRRRGIPHSSRRVTNDPDRDAPATGR